jgi:hypothetical protein
VSRHRRRGQRGGTVASRRSDPDSRIELGNFSSTDRRSALPVGRSARGCPRLRVPGRLLVQAVSRVKTWRRTAASPGRAFGPGRKAGERRVRLAFRGARAPPSAASRVSSAKPLLDPAAACVRRAFSSTSL